MLRAELTPSDRKQRLAAKLKEFYQRLPVVISRLEYQERIEPMQPEVLLQHMEVGLMVPISRAALLEIIEVLDATTPPSVNPTHPPK